ncbi:MAG: chromosome segregation protein SMC [Phycisphaerales bacterium]
MRLAKLTVTGFKSFADKTEFTFDAPVTGIVGPNGCGKSNVVDAIKWVLGERSAKSLRGKEMMDVIFAGSAGRKPAGMASVVLTFDNPELTDEQAKALDARRADELLEESEDTAEVSEDGTETEGFVRRDRGARRALAIDTEQVDVERRLYRDGTSQYLINSRRVRLRDIRELFMDTGVGAHAYSIIEQGKVDAMLLANPVERRIFFEEAAGVAKFKARRVEAMRKLERAETNLVRVREQLDSTERRLRIVRGQAAKARTFRVLDAEHRGLRTALAFHQYDDMQRQLAALTARLRELSTLRERALEGASRLAEERESAEETRRELERDRRVLEDERTGARHRMGNAQQREAITRRQLEEDRVRIASDDERLGDLRTRIRDLDIEAEEHAGIAEDLATKLAETERTLAQASEARQRALDDLTEQRHTLAEQRSRVSTIEREIATCETRAGSERERADHLSQQAAQHEEKARRLENDLSRLRDERAHAEEQAIAHRASVDEIESSIDELVRSSEALGAEQRELAERLNTLERDRARLESRRGALEEMAASRVGLGEAVKRVLDRGAEDRERGDHETLPARVTAPLADLIRVEASDAPAVEAALGPLLQALVIDRVDPRTDRSALDELTGRVTLLPLEGAHADGAPRLPALPESTATRVVRVSERVLCDDELRPVIDRLIGGALLVPDLDAAAMLAMGPMCDVGARFVTPNGEVLEPDGRIIAGPVGVTGEEGGAGLLQRAAELKQLNEQIDGLSGVIDTLNTQAQELDASTSRVHASLADRRHTLAQRQRELVTHESAAERLRADVERLERDLPALQQERDEALAKAERSREEARTLEDRLASLRSDLETLSEERAIVERSLAKAEQQAEEAGEALTSARVVSSQRAEQLAAARRELRRIDAAVGEARRESERLESHLDERRARLAEHQRTIEEALREIEESKTTLQDATARVNETDERLTDVQALADEIAQRHTEAETHAREVERDFQGLELSKRELEVRRETLEDRSLEELALDLVLEFGEYRALMLDGDVTPIDAATVQDEIDDLRTRIKKLGNVNLDSIEEEANLEERNEDLIAQVEDIDRARTHLESLIGRLSEVSRERFKETFQRIEGHFGGKDGMFRRLFGGGRAEVRLIPDPETGEIDWLESGVEVVAKPPGKEPRSISQLSGGEKTMAAVALLLSIFHSKPSPFCVLDEVDAALDDANVDRFGSIVQQFSSGCDFIVITHNKRTMHVCDQLFGVTMQERGVSTRVRVRFEEVGADGRIGREAQRRASNEIEAKPGATQPGSVEHAEA